MRHEITTPGHSVVEEGVTMARQHTKKSKINVSIIYSSYHLLTSLFITSLVYLELLK